MSNKHLSKHAMQIYMLCMHHNIFSFKLYMQHKHCNIFALVSPFLWPACPKHHGSKDPYATLTKARNIYLSTSGSSKS